MSRISLSLLTAFLIAPVLGQQIQLLAPGINHDGYFTTELLSSSGHAFSVESSTNLVQLTPQLGFNQVLSNQLAVIDPRPMEGVAARFYRARLGTTVQYRFWLIHFARSTANQTVRPSFPIALIGFRAAFEVDNDLTVSPATNVVFTGPESSGLTNGPADPDASMLGSTGTAIYQSALIPGTAPGGDWAVIYKGTNLTFKVPDPQASSHFVIPVPGFQNVMPGYLVRWVYTDPATGGPLSAPPSFLTQIQLLIDGGSYQSPNLSPRRTSETVPWPPLDTRFGWRKTTFVYRDTAANAYVIDFHANAP